MGDDPLTLWECILLALLMFSPMLIGFGIGLLCIAVGTRQAERGVEGR